MRVSLLFLAILFVWPLTGTGESAVSQEGSTGGVIPVQIVAGRLVASCDLSTAANRIPANLFIEFEAGHGLQLHNRAAAGLRAESPDGKALPITIHFPDFSLTVPRRELGDEDLFEDFTKYNSVEIGENALVGSIGAELLKEWKVEFRLMRGEIQLSPLEELTGAPRSTWTTDSDGTIHTPITIVNDRVWLPVRRPDGTPGAMMVGCAEADTWVDRDWAESLGKPAGDVGPIKVGALDLHTFVALRPEPLVEVHPDGVVGQIGLNLLSSIDLEIDRARLTARLRVAKAPHFPEGDLAFFRARSEEESAPVAAFLEAYPKSRLAHEASKLLLDLYIDEDAEAESLHAAVQWLGKTIREDLRTTRMLDLMKEMANAGQTEVVFAAGQLGVDSGRDDRYPNAVHNVHGLLGKTYLDRLLDTGAGTKETWSHLLSAAFGLPEDGTINLSLGRFYEYQKRYNRAYSRFIQAVIQPESGPEALVALQRVQPLLESGEAFSVDTIERMIAGKVRNFGAATRFVPTDEEPADKIVLVEFFTNCHLGDERGGAIGGALGNEGLIQHFAPEHVVFLSHHLPSPQPDPLCTSFAQVRADQFNVQDPAVHIIDGIAGTPGAARWRQAEGVYQRARDAIIARLADYADYDIDLQTRLELVDDEWHLRGTTEIYGYEEDDVRVQVVLAEKGVLAPGKSTVVVHRAVARGVLTSSEAGLEYEVDEESGDSMVVELDRTLSSITAENEAFLDRLEADGVGTTARFSGAIDPRQVRVVAFVFRADTGEVLSAAQASPKLPKDWQ